MPPHPTTRLTSPTRRPLRVYAFDPGRGRLLGNEMQMDVRYRSLAPGPTDTSGALDQIVVIDYDVSRQKYYRPVNLDDRFILIPNGVTPSEADPRRSAVSTANGEPALIGSPRAARIRGAPPAKPSALAFFASGSIQTGF